MRRALCLILSLFAACGGAREDRTITWTNDGDAVGFQHGDDGVYVADRDGKNLRRIHRPGDDVVATSTPLWAPQGKRLIFTTARKEKNQFDPRLSRLFSFASDPAGDFFVEVPATYTCWLKTDGEPRPLFEARVHDVGYVAANLAVRWHPSGRKILHVRSDEDGKHGLFEFDLERGTSRRVLKDRAHALIMDYSPDGNHLAVVLDSAIWVDGWRVPVKHKEGPRLESRRAARPAWKPDSSGFAFATAASLRLADVETRKIEVLAEGAFTDLAWHPDGGRLGAVKDEALYVISNGETTHVPSRPVRRFAGWNHAGDHFAYVTPDRIPNTPKESWALLLHADARARDAVYVSGGEADRAVFAGLRATFPRWSPKENKLSVWFTFVPTHRSALSRLLGWGLRPGDPAAIFDPATGTVAWMTVNAFEEAQVGHYHLLKRDYEQAWAWYEKAARGETSARNQPHDFPFFRYICLGAMGRDEDAARELARFRKEFLPRQDGLAGMMSGPKTPVGALLRELYCAEVFLSLDRIGDAEAYFADQPLVLGQLYLLQRRYADYAALEIPAAAADDMMMQMATAFASLPLLCREFLAKLDDAQVEALLARQHDTGLGDLVRRACYRRLGRDKEAKAVRIREQPPWLPADEDYDGLVKQIRELLAREW